MYSPNLYDTFPALTTHTRSIIQFDWTNKFQIRRIMIIKKKISTLSYITIGIQAHKLIKLHSGELKGKRTSIGFFNVTSKLKKKKHAAHKQLSIKTMLIVKK